MEDAAPPKDFEAMTGEERKAWAKAFDEQMVEAFDSYKKSSMPHVCSAGRGSAQVDGPAGSEWWREAGYGARVAALPIQMPDIYATNPECSIYPGAPGGSCPRAEWTDRFRVAERNAAMDQFASEVPRPPAHPPRHAQRPARK